jgi:hypothetical protein
MKNKFLIKYFENQFKLTITFENEVKLSVENTPLISTFTINFKIIINFKILIKIFILIIKLF